MARGPEADLLVFARAPRPGRVKTRLAPALGAEGAALLHARMVERTLRTGIAAGFSNIYLYCDPGVGSQFFRAMRRRFGVRLRPQGGGNLGTRMHGALRRHQAAVLVGTDCPALGPADLHAAAFALDQAEAVFSPAEDGGYALIGVRQSSRALFRGVAWGGARVMAQTRSRLRTLRWRWKELRTVWDVDRPEDVARLRRTRALAPLARGL